MYNVLIVEDDPMVQSIHQQYLEKIQEIKHINTAFTLNEAKKN